MKKIFPSGQYKKDYKRFRNQPKKLIALGKVIDMLANEKPIPAEYLPHKLHGNFKGCMECHIDGDFITDYQLISLIFVISSIQMHS